MTDKQGGRALDNVRCTYCGQWFDFGLGHKCPIISEVAVPPATPPAQLTELQPLIEKWRQACSVGSLLIEPVDVREGILRCADELEAKLVALSAKYGATLRAAAAPKPASPISLFWDIACR